MGDTPPAIYAVCQMDEIAIGDARAFDLARLDEEGEPRPFRIFIVRDTPTSYRGYMNRCPHEGVWLNIGSGRFLDSEGPWLRCGKHGARFDTVTGRCIEGPCEGASLEPVAVVAINGDVCVAGVRLLEADAEAAAQAEETLEITVSPG